MREKNYKQKRADLKEEKRIGLKNSFESNDQRRNFVKDIKRSYRSLKRSEKQSVKKQVENELWEKSEES